MKKLLSMKKDAKAPPPSVDPPTDVARETGDTTTSEDSPIHQATRRGDLAVVQACLDSGADVESIGKSGNRPLHLAAAGGHLKILKCLLEAGASLDATNEDDATPAGLALAHQACLALLRNAAVDDVGALAKLRAESQAESEIDGAESHLEEAKETDPKIRHAAGAAKTEGEPRIISAKATATVAVTAGKAAAKSKATSAIKHEEVEVVETIKPITKGPVEIKATPAGASAPSKGPSIKSISATAAEPKIPAGAEKILKAKFGVANTKPKFNVEKAKSTAAKKPPIPTFGTSIKAKEAVKVSAMPKTAGEDAAQGLGNAPSALPAKLKPVEKIPARGVVPKPKGKAEVKAVSLVEENAGGNAVKMVPWQNRW